MSLFGGDAGIRTAAADRPGPEQETLRLLHAKELLLKSETALGGDAGIRTLVQNRETLRLLHAYPCLNFRA